MADNIAVTPGTGATVAADDVSSVLYQRVKLVTSLDGQAADGLTLYRGAAITAKTAVKASAGQVYGYHIYNPNSVDIYLQFYNVASASVTVGTTTPDKTLWIPAGGALDTGAGLTFPWNFSTAITIAPTTTITGSTTPSTGLLINIDYI
jgi:hypothetical protein